MSGDAYHDDTGVSTGVGEDAGCEGVAVYTERSY